MTDTSLSSQKPNNVTLAIRLLWGVLIIGVVNSALSWNYSISQVPADFPMNKDLFAFLMISITLGITAWLIYKISSGRNWARLVFLIMFIIGIITMAFSVSQLIETFNYSKVISFLTLVTSLLQVIGLILLFSKEGNTWFTTQKALRKQQKQNAKS